MATEDEVTDEQVKFTKTKEAYGVAIDGAKKIIRADVAVRTQQPEQTIQLATQRMNLHDPVRETLGCVEEDLEKAEVTRLQEALKTQRELLMKTERGMQRAKQRTKEPLAESINDWKDLQQNEHRGYREFIRRRWKLGGKSRRRSCC